MKRLTTIALSLAMLAGASVAHAELTRVEGFPDVKTHVGDCFLAQVNGEWWAVPLDSIARAAQANKLQLAAYLHKKVSFLYQPGSPKYRCDGYGVDPSEYYVIFDID